MSRCQALAVVFTLKLIGLPLLTLMLMAKPWMVESPAPLTSQVDCATPGRQFSASIGLAGTAQLADALRGTETRAATAGSAAIQIHLFIFDPSTARLRVFAAHSRQPRGSLR